MILLHIISDEEEQAIEITDFLIENNLILDAVLLEKVAVRKKEKGTPKSTSQTLVMGKTKALLFSTIDQLLKEKYGSKMPIIYSTPIVHMDWEQSKELVNEVAKI